MGQQDHVVHPVSRPRGSDDVPGAERQGDPSAASHRRRRRALVRLMQRRTAEGSTAPRSLPDACLSRKTSSGAVENESFARHAAPGHRAALCRGPYGYGAHEHVEVREPGVREDASARHSWGSERRPDHSPELPRQLLGRWRVARCWLGAGSEGQVRITLTWIFVRRGLPRGSVSGGSGRRCCRGTGPRSRRAADREASGP